MRATRKQKPAGESGSSAAAPRLTLLQGAPATSHVAPRYLTVEEVAAMLRCSPRTIYQMVSQRRIPYRKAGRLLLFDAAEIDRWTQESTRK